MTTDIFAAPPGAAPLRRRSLFVVAALTAALAAGSAPATSVRKASLVDLVKHSDTILAGRVESVTDGVDGRGVPYTEVTLKVGEKLRGSADGKTFTFRQFGLLKPRKMPNGRVNVTLVPDGWARYGVGEDVALFLGAPASQTGLRTTVGLEQGKLAVVNGKVKRSEFTAGLFEGVTFDPGLLGKRQQELVKKARSNQDLEIDQLLGLVRQAVDEDWVGKGRMKNEK